jgi:hypothetical protein
MDTPGTLRRMVGTVPRQRLEGWSKSGRITSFNDLYVSQKYERICVLIGVDGDSADGDGDKGLMFCCCSLVLMTSRGCNRTHETNPLKLPAIRSEVGILKKRICEATL